MGDDVAAARLRPRRGKTSAICRIGYATSCPGPWKVTEPPRSTSTYSAPSDAEVLGAAGHVLRRAVASHRVDRRVLDEEHDVLDRPRAPAPPPGAAAVPSASRYGSAPEPEVLEGGHASDRARRHRLFVRVVRAAHQRTALDVAEAQRQPVLLELGELRRRPEADQRVVLQRRAQVLADGDDLDVVGAQVARAAARPRPSPRRAPPSARSWCGCAAPGAWPPAAGSGSAGTRPWGAPGGRAARSSRGCG